MNLKNKYNKNTNVLTSSKFLQTTFCFKLLFYIIKNILSVVQFSMLKLNIKCFFFHT